MKVLLIDNDFDLLDNIRIILEIAGYEVIWAENGLDGLRLAYEHHPELIICDIVMPEMTGYEVLEELQANSATSTIPFIFLTSKSDLEDIRRGMSAGADDYLTKPFSESSLLEAIHKRLEKRQRLELEQRVQFNHNLVRQQEADLASISQEIEQRLRQKILHLKYWVDSQSQNSNASKEMLFDALDKSLNSTLAEINRISYKIYPAMLPQLGLVLSLQWFFSQQKNPVKLEVYGMERRLQDELELGIYRIVQRIFEAFEGYFEEVCLVLWRDEQNVHLSISDLPYLDKHKFSHLFQLLEEYAQTIHASISTRHDEKTAIYLSLTNAVFQEVKSPELPEIKVDKVNNPEKSKKRLNLDALLTLREREILELILADLTHADIAEKLVISPRTVEKHRANIMQKLGLNSHTELILFAIRYSLISPQ